MDRAEEERAGQRNESLRLFEKTPITPQCIWGQSSEKTPITPDSTCKQSSEKAPITPDSTCKQSSEKAPITPDSICKQSSEKDPIALPLIDEEPCEEDFPKTPPQWIKPLKDPPRLRRAVTPKVICTERTIRAIEEFGSLKKIRRPTRSCETKKVRRRLFAEDKSDAEEKE